MVGHEVLDREPVRHHGAVEAEFAAQHLAKQTGIGGCGYAIPVGQRVHDRAEAAHLDGCSKGAHVNLAELAPAHRHRRHVEPCLAHGVADEVLAGRDHAAREGLPLQVPHEGHAQRADEVGVLPVGLVNSSPARVARDVEQG
jgi:hypothetical protein